jgi:hypothetical protein
MSPQLKMGGSSISLPRSRLARIVIGVLLIFGGILGFLPILGFWMVPLGLLVLSVDLPRVRRWRRQLVVWWERRKRGGNGSERSSQVPERE